MHRVLNLWFHVPFFFSSRLHVRNALNLYPDTTLSNANIVGHNNILELMLLLMMRISVGPINFLPTLIFK